MYSNLKGKKVALQTLGCKVNQYESDAMLESLLAAGCERAGNDNIADIYIINTCSVTNMADRKSRQIIHRMRKLNPDAIIAATGCYVQASKDEVIADGAANIVIGNNRKKDIVRILSNYINNGSFEDTYIDVNKDNEFENLTIDKPETHTRAYIKIQDGCNFFCTYCIIPYVRGRIKSKKFIDVITEAENLAESGVKEIILTGIEVSSYSDTFYVNDVEQTIRLQDVIKRISNINGIERIRLSSLEPRVITEDFLKTVSSLPNFCPHFHLSLQSACNKTLKAMNRHYTIEEFKEICDNIRKYFDRPALTTDIIVGFPGETDEDFETTYNNLKEIGFYEMHVFKYSRRKGTVADRMPDQIDERIKTARSNRLLELTQQQKSEYEANFENESKEVLIEEIVTINGREYYRGHTMRYQLIDIPVDKLKADDKNYYINKLVRI